MIPDYVIQAALDAQGGAAQGDAWTAPQQPVSMGGQPMQPVSLTGQDVKNAIAGVAPYAQKVWGFLNQPQAPVSVVAPQPVAPAPAAVAAPAPPVEAQATQPVAAPEPPAEPQSAQSTGPSPMASVLDSAFAGSQRVVPGGFRKVGYQLAQEGPAPMPGTDIPQAGPTIQTGVADIDPATFRALSPDVQREYLARLASQQTKPLRIGPEPIDMDLFDALTPEQQQEYQRRLDAQTSTISTGPRTLTPSGEPVRPESPYGRASNELADAENRALLGEQQAYEDRAENLDLLARKYAMEEAQANERVRQLDDEQARRAAYVASELPKLESYLEKRAQVQALNPVDEYNKSRGFGGRLMNAIALGLSTLGSGLTGAPNIVWEMIQKEIDGEVLKQRQTTESLGQQYMARRQLYADMLGQFKTPELAEAATRYSLETAAAAAAKRIAARAQGDDARNAAAALVDQAEAKRAATKKALLEGTQRTIWQNVPAQVVGQPGGIAGLVRQLKAIGVQDKDMAPIVSTIVNKGTQAGSELIGTAKPAKSRDEMREMQFERETRVIVPGELGGGTAWATDPQQKKHAQEGLRQSAQLLQSVAQLRKIAQTGSRLSPTDRAFVEQLSATSMGSWRVNLGLGVMSESDKDLIKPLTGEFINNVGLRDRIRMIDNVESMIRRSATGFLNELYSNPEATQPRQAQVRERAVK